MKSSMNRGRKSIRAAGAIFALSLAVLDGNWNDSPGIFASGFTSSRQRGSWKSSRLKALQQGAECSTASPLPPRGKQVSQKRRRRPKHNTKHLNDLPWDGGTIPDQVPKLSEVLSQPITPKTTSQRFSNTHKKIPSRETSYSDPSTSSTPQTPFEAGYYTSLKSQKRIQDAAAWTRKNHPPIYQASHVLSTFLSIPPERCNTVNLVCALTLSAQVMGPGGGGSDYNSNKNLRSLLYQTLDILTMLLNRKALSARQLCNAVWAIAKHADRDDSLLPASSSSSSSSMEQRSVLVSAVDDDSNAAARVETWDLRTGLELKQGPAERANMVIDEIARQLCRILQSNSRAAKEGELCMAGWAFGILRKRQRPPGWKQGPQLGQLSGRTTPLLKKRQQGATDLDLIRFEQWNGDDNSICDVSPTDILFDKIGETLLEPLDISGVDREGVALRIQKCRWNELANLAWAFATHGSSCSHFAQELMLEVACEATRRLQGGSTERALSRDVAQIVWSLGTLQADNYRLAEGLVELVGAVSSEWVDIFSPRPLDDWSCPDIVQVALSLAHARLDDRPLLRALYTEASRRLASDLVLHGIASQHRKQFFAWEISILLWSQARLHLKEDQGDCFPVFAKEAVRSIHRAVSSGQSMDSLGIGPQEEANIAWSLTLLQLYQHTDAKDLLETIFKDAATMCETRGLIQLEHAHQLWQALFVLEEECPACVANVPRWFYDDLRSKWFDEKSRTKISSSRHKSLSKLLDLMGVTHCNEHDEDIDVAIVLKPQASWTHETESDGNSGGVKVAVEFDGPNHFTRQRMIDSKSSEPPRALGHTVFKYRLLRRQGWTVVRVPYYEFDRIPFWASMERQRYLQRLLKTHCGLRFSQIDVSEYRAPVHNKKSRFE
jgi:hypothetical protein